MISRTGASARAAPAAASPAGRRRIVSSTCLSPLESNRVVATRPGGARRWGQGNPYSRAGLWTSTWRRASSSGQARKKASHSSPSSGMSPRTFGCGQSVPTRCARAWPPPAPARRGCPRRTAACPRRCGPGPTLSPRRPAGPPGPTTRERPARPARRPRAPGPCGQSRRAAAARAGAAAARQLGAVQMQAQMPAQRRDQADHMVEDGRVRRAAQMGHEVEAGPAHAGVVQRAYRRGVASAPAAPRRDSGLRCGPARPAARHGRRRGNWPAPPPRGGCPGARAARPAGTAARRAA